ncbi:MAG: class I SAM-dependent methyltransferase [Stellaceae bacterium]
MNPVVYDSSFSAAKHLKWLIDDTALSAKELVVSGWIISLVDDLTDYRILLNGAPFDSVTIHRPDLALSDVYEGLDPTCVGRFTARRAFARQTEIFPNRYAEMSIESAVGSTGRNYRNAWYIWDPSDELPIPEDFRIRRVIGTNNSSAYLMGGATAVLRHDQYLIERFAKGIGEFNRILDWGCGSARLSRYLLKINRELRGADIDADNIAWCNHHIGDGRFFALNLMPPTPFSDEEFDLFIGISVFTHLAEREQFAWLDELRRITVPGAIGLVSIQGPSHWAMQRLPADFRRRILKDHFVVKGENRDVSAVISDQEYYRDVYHSRDYIFAKWSTYFEVIDIIDALAASQDTVVLRRR